MDLEISVQTPRHSAADYVTTVAWREHIATSSYLEAACPDLITSYYCTDVKFMNTFSATKLSN